MSDCECLERCPFFNDRMANMPAMAHLVKQRYCQGDWARCARHQVFEALGSEHVPSDLFPSQLERVEPIIRAAQAT